MNLTVDEIREDISEYQERISSAREKLSELPEGYLPFKQHKIREKQRRDLQAEIKHVEILTGYAFEGLVIRQAEVCCE